MLCAIDVFLVNAMRDEVAMRDVVGEARSRDADGFQHARAPQLLDDHGELEDVLRLFRVGLDAPHVLHRRHTDLLHEGRQLPLELRRSC